MDTLGSYSIAQVNKRLEEWNLTSKKRWGQNFLLDKDICKKNKPFCNSVSK